MWLFFKISFCSYVGLVCPGCLTKYHRLGGFDNWSLLLPALEAEDQDQGIPDLAVLFEEIERAFPGLGTSSDGGGRLSKSSRLSS